MNYLEDNYRFWNDSLEQNIINLTRNSSGKADPEKSAILIRFQNVSDLSKYIIDTYDRLGSSVQYEIQQLLVESNGMSEEETR